MLYKLTYFFKYVLVRNGVVGKYLLGFLFILVTLESFQLKAQPQSYLDIVNKIQTQEINFPFPQKDTTILLGEISGTADQPKIHFLIPFDNIRIQHIPGTYEPDLHPRRPGEPDGDFIVGAQEITDTDRAVNAGNHFHMNLRLKIVNWMADAENMVISIGSKTKTVPKDSSEVLFEDVLDTDPIVSCYYPATRVIVRPLRPGVEKIVNNMLHIKWDVAGAGIVTLPVLPVKIIYAPVVDFKRSNHSSVSNTTSVGYATSISVTSSESKTTPLPTPLTGTDDFLQSLNEVGKAMEYEPDPDVQGIAKAIQTISTVLIAGLGSESITRTISNSETNQTAVAVTATETDQLTAKSVNGGPGEGDVIAFYKNAKFVWLANKGRLQLLLLGYEPELKTPTARQLKQELLSLRGKPEGTLDPLWKIDSKSITSLLALDPFTGPNGPFVKPDPTRFVIARKTDGSEASFQNGGADETISVFHQIESTDVLSLATVVSNAETDKPGFLSFLGGPKEDKTIQMVYSKSISSQYKVGQSLTGAFTLYGDGDQDHYHCEVFFDNVFGTFAFRDNSLDLDGNNTVNGILLDSNKRVLPNTLVLLKAHNKTLATTSDKKGKFHFQLPYKFSAKEVTLFSAGDSSKLNLGAQHIQNFEFTLNKH